MIHFALMLSAAVGFAADAPQSHKDVNKLCDGQRVFVRQLVLSEPAMSKGLEAMKFYISRLSTKQKRALTKTARKWVDADNEAQFLDVQSELFDAMKAIELEISGHANAEKFRKTTQDPGSICTPNYILTRNKQTDKAAFGIRMVCASENGFESYFLKKRVASNTPLKFVLDYEGSEVGPSEVSLRLMDASFIHRADNVTGDIQAPLLDVVNHFLPKGCLSRPSALNLKAFNTVFWE